MAEDLMGWWNQLRTAVLMGTERRPVPDPEVLPVVGRPDAPPEAALLDQMALAAAWRAAGARPSSGGVPEPAPPETLSVAPVEAVRLLELALTQTPGGSSRRPETVLAWVQYARAAGCRVPSRLIPELLRLAEGRRDIARPIMSVLGESGQWVAAQSPVWRSLLTDDVAPPDVPVTGSADWRVASTATQLPGLIDLHRDDPQRARDLVRELLVGASATDRHAYLEALATHLTVDDEPLVESALTDRSAKVRDLAVKLLDRLPTGARGRRMAARLQPLLRVDRSLVGRPTLRVDLPVLDDDPDLARDALVPTSADLQRVWLKEQGQVTPRSSTPPEAALAGLRQAWQLERIIAASPLSVWDTTGLDPNQIIGQLKTSWKGMALAGLRRAAIAQREPLWAQALAQLPDPVGDDLLEILPQSDHERLALAWLARDDYVDMATVLHQVPGPWSESFSHDVVRHLVRSKRPEWAGRCLDASAGSLNPAVLPYLRRLVEESSYESPLHSPLVRAVSFLSFRQSISEAFQ